MGSALAAIGIWWGIAAMMRANKQRAAGLDQQRKADEQRHAETMAALEQQRLADERRHAETMAALEASIERTAPDAAKKDT